MVNIVIKILFLFFLLFNLLFLLKLQKNPSYIYMNINVVASISVA